MKIANVHAHKIISDDFFKFSNSKADFVPILSRYM